MSGWLKLHRGILDWEWKKKPLTVALWVHILAKANHKPSRYQGHDIPAGSFVSGVKALSEQTGLSVSQVRTALNHLEREEIAIKKTNKFSIITIVKWDEYQEVDKQVANKSQTNDKQVATSKERKKERRKEVIQPQAVCDDVWKDFKKLRSRKKAPITETAMNTICLEAERAGWPLEDVLREMSNRGWTGFKADWVENNGKHRKNNGKHGGRSISQRADDATREVLAEYGITAENLSDSDDCPSMLRHPEHLRQDTGAIENFAAGDDRRFERS